MNIDKTWVKNFIQSKIKKVGQSEEKPEQELSVDSKIKRLKAEEKAIFGGILSILLCCVMLAGSTMAWYTASVSSPVTSIKSGTFDLSVSGGSGYSTRGSNNLQFVSHATVDRQGNIVTEETEIDESTPVVWGPGDIYTLQPLYISNTGTIDMNVQLFLSFSENKTEQDEKANLQLLQALKFIVTAENVPDVGTITKELTFPKDDASFNPMIVELKDSNNRVTGYEVKTQILDNDMFLAAPDENQERNTLPVIVTIKAVMPLDTGAAYASKTLNNINVIVNATQAVENNNAEATTNFTAVSNSEELFNALGRSGKIVLKNDIELENGKYLTIAQDKEIHIDLQGYELKGKLNGYLIQNEGKLTVTGGTLNNTETDENKTDGIIRAAKGEVILHNVTLVNRVKTHALYGEEGAVLKADFDLGEYCVKRDYDYMIGNDSDDNYTIKRKIENQ